MTKQILISASVVLALLAGCGGGSEGGLSKAEFIKAADAICKKADSTELGEAAAYIHAHPEVAKKISQPSGHAILLRAVALPSVLREAEEIEALGAPSGEEEKVEKFLAEVREAVKKAEKDPLRAEERLQNRQENPDYSFREVDKLGGEYGFKQCNEVI